MVFKGLLRASTTQLKIWFNSTIRSFKHGWTWSMRNAADCRATNRPFVPSLPMSDSQIGWMSSWPPSQRSTVPTWQCAKRLLFRYLAKVGTWSSIVAPAKSLWTTCFSSQRWTKTISTNFTPKWHRTCARDWNNRSFASRSCLTRGMKKKSALLWPTKSPPLLARFCISAKDITSNPSLREFPEEYYFKTRLTEHNKCRMIGNHVFSNQIRLFGTFSPVKYSSG